MMGQQTPMANNVPTGGGVGVTPPPPPPSSTMNGSAPPPPPPPPQGQQGPVKKARSGYNAKAMAEIRNSLRPFEESSGQPNGQVVNGGQLLGAGSGRPLSSLSYNECIQALVNLGFDEDTSCRAMNQGGNRIDAALDLLRAAMAAGATSSEGSSSRSTTPIHRKPAPPPAVPGLYMEQHVNGAPPALPPRTAPSHHMEPPGQPPRVPPIVHPVNGGAHPVVTRKYSPSGVSTSTRGDLPPPLPPPRGGTGHNPPPTPPRGTTPPPSSMSICGTSSGASSNSSSMAVSTTSQQHVPPPPPPLLRRMSPVPSGPTHRTNTGTPSGRGASPGPSQTTGQQQQQQTQQRQTPICVANSREIQAQVLQTIQSLSMFPPEGPAGAGPNAVEPPPPYPMGTAALTSNPPPSYSQSLAMRQSPTLSSTSSDYRRSPAPGAAAAAAAAAAAMYGVTSPVPGGVMPSPSPVSSVLSSSTSRSTPWSSRQATTQSPVIMQSVKSTQVAKPVLQTAGAPLKPVNPVMAEQAVQAPTPAAPTQTVVAPDRAAQMETPPPPSYEFSIQQKQQQNIETVIGRSPVTVPRSTQPPRTPQPPPVPPPPEVGTKGGPGPLPPPPPYPSTAVQSMMSEVGMVNGQACATAKTAKVSKTSATGRFSPLPQTHNSSETGSSAAASRSESPVSDSHTLPAASPLSFVAAGDYENAAFGAAAAVPPGSPATQLMPPPPPPPYKTTHHTSPKPERRVKASANPDYPGAGLDGASGNIGDVSQAKSDPNRTSMMIRSCPPQAFKFFMEQHVENVIKEYDQRRQRQMRLERELVQYGIKDPHMKEQMRAVLRRKETNYLRMRRAKLNKNHFKKIKTIGIGAFGEVSLVRSVNGVGNAKTGGLYAMKTLKKSHVVERKQVAHVIAEKDILAEADNDWIVKLYYSFQDKDNLYFVMEYIPGGDLMSMLIKEGRFTESLARFYIAELTCAVESVHSMGFIHRDIKPDNILIDAAGHIKLTDFGLCTGFRWTHNSEYYHTKNAGAGGGGHHYRQDSMDPINMEMLNSGNCSCPLTAKGLKPLERRKARQQQQRDMAHSLVGTPNYIAPEVLLKQGYTQSCDWWSVGVILYEMIIGQPPFLADNTINTQAKVIRWRETLHIPPGVISPASEDLIRGLCTEADSRLGSQNGARDIKSHPFFGGGPACTGIDFSKPLRDQCAPWRPEILYETDTSNFDPIDPERLMTSDEESDDGGTAKAKGKGSKKDYHGFYEFTFRRFFDDGGHPLRTGHQRVYATDDSGAASDASANTAAAAAAAPDPVYV